MANFFETLEDNTITRLSSLITDNIDVTNFPELQAGQQPAITKPRVTVMYAGEKGKPTDSTDLIVQDTEVFVMVQIESVKRRGPGGLYEVIEKVRKRLVGYKPANCRVKFTLGDGKYEELQGQVWNYIVAFNTSRTFVEDYEEPAAPLLNQLNVNAPDGSWSFTGDISE